MTVTQEKITDSHFGYFRVFKEYPQESQIWKSETSPNQGTWLGISWLGLVSLCQIWDFCWLESVIFSCVNTHVVKSTAKKAILRSRKRGYGGKAVLQVAW